MLLPNQKGLSEGGVRLGGVQEMSMAGRDSNNGYLRKSLVEGKYSGDP